MLDVVQAVVRPSGARFVAESFRPALQFEADSLDAAVAGLEDALREQLTDGAKFFLAVSLYFGPPEPEL